MCTVDVSVAENDNNNHYEKITKYNACIMWKRTILSKILYRNKFYLKLDFKQNKRFYLFV